MSRVIVNDHLWDDDEIEYQHARNRYRDVALNKKLFGPGGELEGLKPLQSRELDDDEDDVLELDQDIYDHVLSLKVPALRSELKAHKVIPEGDEKTLRVMLAQVLQGERDDSTDS